MGEEKIIIKLWNYLKNIVLKSIHRKNQLKKKMIKTLHLVQVQRKVRIKMQMKHLQLNKHQLVNFKINKQMIKKINQNPNHMYQNLYLQNLRINHNQRLQIKVKTLLRERK